MILRFFGLHLCTLFSNFLLLKDFNLFITFILLTFRYKRKTSFSHNFLSVPFMPPQPPTLAAVTTTTTTTFTFTPSLPLLVFALLVFTLLSPVLIYQRLHFRAGATHPLLSSSASPISSLYGHRQRWQCRHFLRCLNYNLSPCHVHREFLLE